MLIRLAGSNLAEAAVVDEGGVAYSFGLRR